MPDRDEPRPRPRARGLLLDIGGVVLRNGVELADSLAQREPALQPMLASLGGLGGARDDLWRDMLAGRVSERAYWSQRSAEMGSALGRTWDTRVMINTMYDAPQATWLRAEVVQLMSDVRAAGLPLGALTNDLADFHGQEWVEAQEWLRLFEVIVDASHTGVMKPDPRAFQAGAEAIGLPPGDIVYLDDMPWNVNGALAAGLDAVRVERDDPLRAVSYARDRLGLSLDAIVATDHPTGRDES